MAIITLTTDFGVSDAYVGVMKGVMLGINRESVFVDITHDIAPQNVRQAAYVLYSAFSFFPEGSVHLCVVDPGVGSKRRPIIFEAQGHLFVGPDNGVFTKILRRFRPEQVYEIADRGVIGQSISNTFHGRDIFAPATAMAARGGAAPDSFGPVVPAPVTLDLPMQAQPAPNIVEGSVIYIDHFGNAVTNITSDILDKVGREMAATSVEIETHAGVINRLSQNYSAAPNDKLLCATIAGWNTLELFVNSGAADKLHGLAVNDRVEVRFF